MNNVILMGRLTRDPDVRYTSNSKGEQMAVARYTLAVDRFPKRDGEATADFIPCVAFSKLAENAEKYFHKGTKLVVSGRIQTGSYTNKDGQKVYTTDIVVETQEFAESKGTNTANNPLEYNPSQADGDGFMSIPDDVGDEGLPFN